MEEYLQILSQCPLFSGVEGEELVIMLDCLGGRTVEAAKGTPVFLEGDPVRFVGVVLSGAVQIVREDYRGNRSVLDNLQPGDLFAEVFVCAGLETMPVGVLAVKDSRILLLDWRQILTACADTGHSHALLLQNLLRAMAQKNLGMNRKIRYMSQKTTRDKLTAYLFDQAKQAGREEFVIPYDRQALADYLGVERSAMSAELGKMKREGLLDTRGSWFRLCF